MVGTLKNEFIKCYLIYKGKKKLLVGYGELVLNINIYYIIFQSTVILYYARVSLSEFAAI